MALGISTIRRISMSTVTALRSSLLFLGLFGATEELLSQVAEEWVARFGGPGTSSDVARSIGVDAAGNVYVTGTSGSFIDYDYVTIKYNSLGVQQWMRRYNGPGSPYSYDYAYSIVVDPPGNAYVTGGSWGNGAGGFDCTTIKYNTSGDQEWIHRYNGPQTGGNDIGSFIKLDASGNVYVTGQTTFVYNDCLTLKYNSSGVLQWAQGYNGELNLDDGAYSLALDGSGNVYIAGTTTEEGGYFDYVTIKYNSSGSEQWVRTYFGSASQDDVPLAIAVDGSENVFVTGYSHNGATGFDYTTIQYSTSGVQQWVETYNGPLNSGDFGYSLVLDGLGNVLVTGSSYGGNGVPDYATVKYTSSGTQLWASRYDGPALGSDVGHVVVSDNSGNAYVTGESAGSGTLLDFSTVKYSSSGLQQWVQRYNGPGNSDDRAYAMAIDASGNIYVTGESVGNGTGADFATIKYSQDQGVSCSDIDQFQSRCAFSGTIRARVILNNTSHTGQTVEFMIDGSSYIAEIESRGTSSRAQISVSGFDPGSHTVLLMEPAGCFDPLVVNCPGGAEADGDVWMEEEKTVEETLSLSNYPNPFNPSTTISYFIDEDGWVTLKVYSVLGEEVVTLINEFQKSGARSVVWNGRSKDGVSLASGIYVYRLQAGNIIRSEKMLLTK